VETVAKPLADVTYYTEPCCDYPTMVKLTMDDGQVMTYVLQNKTDYQFQKLYESMKKLDSLVEGYQYRGRHERKRP
jgi:hypothetical protein